MRRRHFDIANNSLHEVIGAVDLAEAIGAVDSDAAHAILALASRLKPMIRAQPRSLPDERRHHRDEVIGVLDDRLQRSPLRIAGGDRDLDGARRLRQALFALRIA